MGKKKNRELEENWEHTRRGRGAIVLVDEVQGGQAGKVVPEQRVKQAGRRPCAFPGRSSPSRRISQYKVPWTECPLGLGACKRKTGRDEDTGKREPYRSR